MTQRLKLIEEMLLPGSNIEALCAERGVSRKTAYKWLNRYREEGIKGLCDARRVPQHQPLKTPPSVEAKILKAHELYPYWGPSKLRDYLMNQFQRERWPSHTTIGKILERNQCWVEKSQKSPSAFKRFEREIPNELWQMDFKGYFKTLYDYCHPLTIIDDHSRYSIALEACENETGMTVKTHLTRMFERYGLPDQINVDNGNPWGNSGLTSCTAIGIWLMKLNIRLSHSSPYHPQTNGKDERFHRTLKLELLNRNLFKNCADAQKSFEAWRHHYNFVRPHHALSGQPPATRYKKSNRPFPSRFPEPIFEETDIVRRCDKQHGTVRYKGKRYRVGKGLGGEYLALRETENPKEMSVFFMGQFIKKLDLSDPND